MPNIDIGVIVKNFYYLLILFMITFNQNSFPKLYIFDLHGVLVEHGQAAMAGQIGWFNAWKHGNTLESRLYEFLALAEPAKDSACVMFVKGEVKPMPKMMVDWQKGKIASQEFVTFLKDLASKNKTFFKSDSEKDAILALVDAMLPQKLCEIVYPVNEMVQLVEHCKANMDKDDKLVILSNWDKESFSLVKNDKKFKRLFDCFHDDHVIVSGVVGKAKPEEDIYDHILHTFKVKPAECIFVDDQKPNIEAASKKGFKTILHKNVKETKGALVNLGLGKKA